MRASLAGEWRRAGPAQRFACLAGGVLIVAGVAHGAAWLVAGGAWQGPVSFRKPATFGLSFGLTTITLAWVTGRLRVSGRTRWLLLGPLAAADATEVAWLEQLFCRDWNHRSVRRVLGQTRPHAHLSIITGDIASYRPGGGGASPPGVASKGGVCDA
jgi:hypothetical protein